MMNGYGQDFQATGGGSPTLNAPKSTPPMDVSVKTLAQNIERLQMAVQNLQSKLEPVLYPEPPSPLQTTNGVEARAPRASSSLGSSVNSFSDQIEGITDRVNALYRRCEL